MRHSARREASAISDVTCVLPEQECVWQQRQICRKHWPAGSAQICPDQKPAASLSDTFTAECAAAGTDHGDRVRRSSGVCRMLQQCGVSGAARKVSDKLRLSMNSCRLQLHESLHGCNFELFVCFLLLAHLNRSTQVNAAGSFSGNLMVDLMFI